MYSVGSTSIGKKRQYRIVQEINKGNFAHAFKAQAGRTYYFLKQYKDPSTLFTPWFKAYEPYQGEIVKQLMSPGTKDFIVTIEDIYIHDDFYIQVHSWQNGCDLKNRIKSLDLMNDKDKRQALAIARSFLWGMDLIHQAGIIHSDLKPDNIFLKAEEEVLITDFDWSLLAGQKHPWEGNARSTAGYASFEHLGRRAVTSKSDIFTCGIILCQLLAGYQPMKRLLQPNVTLTEEALYKYLHERISRVGVEEPLDLNPRAALTPSQSKMLQMCFSPDPSRRPTAAELHRALLTMSVPVSLWLNHSNGFSLITQKHDYENKVAFLGRSKCLLYPNSEYVSNLQAWLSPSADYCYWYLVAPARMPTHSVRVSSPSGGKLKFINGGTQYEVGQFRVMMSGDQILLETGQKIEIFNVSSGQIYVEWVVELKSL